MIDPTRKISVFAPAIQQGDTKAFQKFHAKYFKGLFFFAKKLTGSDQDSEEIVSDSFVKLWRLRASFDNDGRMVSFLMITTRNACFDYLSALKLKSAKQQKYHYLLQSRQEEELPVDIDDFESKIVERLFTELDRLPPRSRMALKLSYIDKLPASTIAERMNISVHTVRGLKVNAIKLLRMKMLDRDLVIALLIAAASIQQEC